MVAIRKGLLVMLQKFDPDKGQFDVVIIGAGIAGLTAAVTLAERSDRKILILEGEHTIGGRARSIKLANGTRTDEGAHWFHGADDNPFFRWARGRYHLGEIVNDTTQGRMTIWSDRRDPEGSLRKAFNKLDAGYASFVEKNPDKDISLDKLARMVGGSAVREAAQFIATEWMARNGPEQISCTEYFNDPLGPGGWQIKGGMNRLVHQIKEEAICRGVQIRTGQTVTDIQDCSDNVYITLATGEPVYARQCLVTVSAGVLKSRAIAFEPRVEKAARSAVSGVAMGHMTKLILPMKEEFFSARNIEPDTRVYMIDSGYFVHARSAGEPTITIFRGGSPAYEMESLGQKKLLKIASGVLSQIDALKDFKESQDGPIVVTGWGGNKLTQGSYSIGKPHRFRSDPIECGPIKFAGEAFIADPKDSPGQLPAAWLSAQKIVPALL